MGMHSFAESSNLGERSNSAVRFSNLQRGGAVTPPRAHSSAQRSNSAQRSDSARVCNSALSCKRTHTPKRKARAKSPVRESMERADHDRLDNADQAPWGRSPWYRPTIQQGDQGMQLHKEVHKFPAEHCLVAPPWAPLVVILGEVFKSHYYLVFPERSSVANLMSIVHTL